jgi:hypothetical protein
VSDALPVAIAAWSGGLALAAVLVWATASTILGPRSEAGQFSLTSAVGRGFVAAVVFGIPIAVITFFSIFGSALLIAIGAPAIAYPYVSVAALAGLYAAYRAPHGSDGQGCNRLAGLFACAFVTIWGGVSWWLLGGPAAWPADLAGGRWLLPPLAALVFGIGLVLIGKGKRSVWLFLSGMAFFSGWLALIFFPIEAGFAAEWLPRNDFLRFPLAGIATGALVAAAPTGLQLAQKRRARASGREMWRLLLLATMLGGAMGLAWAAARALLASAAQ